MGDSDTPSLALIHDNDPPGADRCKRNHCAAFSGHFHPFPVTLHKSRKMGKRLSLTSPTAAVTAKSDGVTLSAHTWHEVKTSGSLFVAGVAEKAMACKLEDPAFSPISVPHCVALAKSLKYSRPQPGPLIIKVRYVESCHFQLCQLRISFHAEQSWEAKIL